MDGPRLDPFRDEGVRLDRRLDRLRRKPLGKDGTNDAVAVAHRDQVGRDASGHHQTVLDGLVTVAVAQGDLVARHGGHEDHPVRHRGAVGDRIGPMRPEHARRVFLVRTHRSAVVEQ